MDKIAVSLFHIVAVYLSLCSVPVWSLSFTLEPSNETVAIGNSLMLNCLATDSGSVPVISWQKDGVWLTDPVQQPWRYLVNNSLYYQSVSAQDVGKFRCGASISGTSNIIYSRVAEVKLAYIDAVFTTPPMNQSVRFGANSAYLDCMTGRSLPNANVYWEKDGQKFTAGQEQLYKLSSGLTSSSLLIKSITFSSSGWYRCVAVNPLLPNQPRHSQSAYLNVIPSRDMPHFQVQPTNLLTGEHVDAMLQCLILGVPKPQVSWTHNGQQILDTANRHVLSNGSLYFSAPINRSYAGQYVCTGRNSAGSISSSPILFNIAYFEFDFLENPSNKTATVEDPVTLKCGPPHSFPPQVAIHWYHNYREIQQGNGVTIDQSVGTLSFTSIEKSDEGMYFCSGKNTVSMESRTSAIAYVTVNVPPGFQLRPRNSSVIKSQSLMLDCEATGSPQPSLTWIKDGQPVDSSRVKILINGSLSISSTVVGDAGKYTCTGTNVAGSAAASALVTINVLPSPNPSQVPRNATRTVGESVTFVCEFDGIPKPTITWFHDGALARVEVQSSVNYVLTSRSLEIRQIMKKDEGTYICQGKNSAGSAQVSAYLKVQVPVSLDSGPINVTINESSIASFQCSASGDPKPTVTWYKGDIQLVTGGRVVIGVNSLTILQTSRTDAGYYSCNVSNGLAFETAAAFLLVQVVPNITSITVPALVGLGSNATLSCSANGIPAPRVTWQRQGVDLGGPRVIISGGGNIMLIDVSRADNGSYTCVAENPAGRDMKSRAITVQVPPSPPISLSATPLSSTEIKLAWKPGFDGYSPITGYSVSVKRGNGSYSQLLHQSQPTMHLVDHLAPYQVYTFKVTAWNKVGQGKAAVVQNRTLESAPSAPQSMSAVPLNASAIRIEWETPEYPNGVVTWYEIQYNLSHNDLISIPVSADSRRQAVICGLAPYTVYVFSVRAATGQQLKLWGNFTTRSERTKEAGPSEAPQDVHLSPIPSTSIIVTWKAVPVRSHNGVIRRYIIHYKPVGPYHFGNVTMVTIKGNDTFNYTLHHLHPWTNYSVAVQAFTVAFGPKSGWKTKRTLEAAPAGPPNVTLVAESENSIMVHLTYPEKRLRNGVIRGFTVYYRLEEGLWTPVKSNSTSVRLTNLKVYTKYWIKASAFTSVGQGNNSSATDLITLEGVPGPVQGLGSRADSYDTMTVFWQVPKEKNGNIQNYMVFYNSTDGKSSGSVTTSQLSVKLSNMSPNTTYIVWVKARTSKGYGAVSVTKSTTSIPSVTVSAGKYGIITVTWKPLQPSKDAQYRVHFKPASSSNVTTVTDGDLRVQLNNLTTHANYTIWVMAVSTDGEETFITTFTATTYVPAPSSSIPSTVAAEGETSGRLTERDMIIVIVCVGAIVVLLLLAAVYFVAIRPRTSEGKLFARKGGNRLRSPELELQGGGQRNAGFDAHENASTVGTEDSFGSFDVDDWPSTITGQQSEHGPQYAVAQTGSKKSPLVELRSKKLSLGSQDSFYDQPYTSLEELGAGFTSFGPPPPPAFRSTATDSSDTDSSKTLPIDFSNSNRLSFTNQLYPAAMKFPAASDPDEELDKELANEATKNDDDGVHGIENEGVRSDSAEPPKPDGAEGAAENSGEFPIYAKPDKTKKAKYKKMKEGEDKSSASSVSSYHLVDESGKAVHEPVVVYDERTNL